MKRVYFKCYRVIYLIGIFYLLVKCNNTSEMNALCRIRDIITQSFDSIPCSIFYNECKVSEMTML
jgi:hypothetical protein